MKRRTFLSGFGVILWGGGTAFLFKYLKRSGEVLSGRESDTSSYRRVADLTYPAFLRESAFMAGVGSVYLDMKSNEKNRPFLVKSITGGGGKTDTDDKRVLCFTRAIGEKIRKEFENSDVVVIDGWAMSQTEARICALHVLRRKINQV